VQKTCWFLGAEEEQLQDMLPETVSMGFPLVGDLSRFDAAGAEGDSAKDDPEGERQLRAALASEFRLAYPGVLEAREHAARRVADPFGLWLFSARTNPSDLVVVHAREGDGREAVAIVEVTGPYFFLESSPWPHRLPTVPLNLDRWKLPNPYSGWGDLFALGGDDNRLLAMLEALTGRKLIDREPTC
jgi:hypothetical protein